MEKFFYPQSLAVVGVSENPYNLARGIVDNLVRAGYQGDIFPVGPRGGSTHGFSILPHLRELPQPVDLAVVLTPARFVPQVVADCGELGITRVVVESGGFSELGEQGRALEDEVRALIQEYGIRLVGPNGLGTMNLEIGLALPFSQIPAFPRPGGLSVVSQSGGVGMHLIAWMTREGLGLNKFLSLGNKMDVAENETLAYLLQDPGTQAVYLYLEGLEEGRELMALAQQSQKPVFIQLPNVGPETSAIAWSHTASLASDERVIDAACKQAGMVRLKSQAEFLVAAKMVGRPPVRGNRVVILSRSGGEAVIGAYACRQWGFKLPPLPQGLAALIHERSRSGIIKPTNPVDLGDIFDFTVYCEVMEALCRDPEVDAVVLNYGPVYEPEREEARKMAKVLIDLAEEAHKPLAISICASLEEESYFRDELGLPVFRFPGEAVRALAYSRTWAARPEVMLGRKSPRFHLERVAALLAHTPTGFLSLPDALSLLPLLGVPVPGWQTAASLEECLAAARDLGYPVCLKLCAASLIHKTEAGGVQLNLLNPKDLTAAYAHLEALAQNVLPLGEPWEVLVMSQVQEGEEVILGARRDHAFGPVVAFGAGGIWTEVVEDVALRVAPISAEEARRQILETKIGQILRGVRGKPPADLDALSRVLTALSQLMMAFPQVQEVDLNPVRAFLGSRGILALDARVKVAPVKMGRGSSPHEDQTE
ncbi:MAG: hypothetical protein FJ128_02870 [Deltaproteobacteria bacterium]|nr:hypothetical protein [Deltaproteobacteria bacterium]